MRKKGVEDGRNWKVLVSDRGDLYFFPFWLGCRLLFNTFPFPPSTAKFLGEIKKT